MKVAAAQIQRSDSLRDQVYQTLREQIRLGSLTPADRLTEVGVAEALGVSRTPAREALAILERDGLLRQVSRGFSVPFFTEAELLEIYDLRRLLEPSAIKRAVENRTVTGVAAMSDALRDQRNSHVTADVDGFVRANGRFRDAWIGMVPNQRLVRAVLLYADHMQFLRVRLANPAEREVVIRNLGALTAAVTAGKSSAAAKAMRLHIDDSYGSARQFLRERSAPKGRVG